MHIFRQIIRGSCNILCSVVSALLLDTIPHWHQCWSVLILVWKILLTAHHRHLKCIRKLHKLNYTGVLVWSHMKSELLLLKIGRLHLLNASYSKPVNSKLSRLYNQTKQYWGGASGCLWTLLAQTFHMSSSKNLFILLKRIFLELLLYMKQHS